MPGNAGQVVRTYLEENGINMEEFVIFGGGTKRIRKAKKR